MVVMFQKCTVRMFVKIITMQKIFVSMQYFAILLHYFVLTILKAIFLPEHELCHQLYVSMYR